MSGPEPLYLRCARGDHRVHRDNAVYVEALDEYLCLSCYDSYCEATWQREQERLMEDGPEPTLAEQQAEAKKLK